MSTEQTPVALDWRPNTYDADDLRRCSFCANTDETTSVYELAGGQRACYECLLSGLEPRIAPGTEDELEVLTTERDRLRVAWWDTTLAGGEPEKAAYRAYDAAEKKLMVAERAGRGGGAG